MSDITNNPLCFTAYDTYGCSISLKQLHNYPNIYYSYDKVIWHIWENPSIPLTCDGGESIYFYGNNPNGFTTEAMYAEQKYHTFVLQERWAASGDITSLISPEGTDTIPNIGCFTGLFEGCTTLLSAPELPATNLTPSCYRGIFYGCTGLKGPINLPAQEILSNSYSYMFYRCSSLVDISVSGHITQYNADSWLDNVSEYGIVYALRSSGDVYGKPEKWVVIDNERMAFNWYNNDNTYVFAVNGDIPNNTTLGYIYDEDDESSEIRVYYNHGSVEYDDEDWNTSYGTIDYHFNQLNNKQLWIKLDMNGLRATYFDDDYNINAQPPTITGVDNTSQCWDGSTIHNGTGTITITDEEDGAVIYYSIDNGGWIEYTFPIQLTTGTYTIKSYATKAGIADSDITVYGLTVSEAEECPKQIKHTYIVTRINQILEDMVNDEYCDLASYQYEDKPTANVKLDNKNPSPTALFIQITDWKLSFDRMTVKEKAYVNISFLSKESKLDAGGIEQDVIIAEMKDLAVDFLQRLLEDKSLRLLDDTIDMKSVFLRSDSNRTGVNISLEVEEKQGECIQ